AMALVRMFVAITFAMCIIALLGMTANASVRMRVHILTEKPANLNEQCEWENRAKKCATGLTCIVANQKDGFCKKNQGAKSQ
ncbi:hypothetical protein L9G74_21585, partial [Shewanella sp. C32]